MYQGLCPKCEKPLSHVCLDQITIQMATGRRLNGVSYLCSECKAILGEPTDFWMTWCIIGGCAVIFIIYAVTLPFRP
jgi:hypothetical protein